MLLTKRKTLPLASGLAASVLALLVTGPWGPGITPDSVSYVAVARHLMSGAGLTTHLGERLVLYPPLYPSFLALVGRVFRVDPLLAGHISSALLLGVVVYMSGLLMLKHLRSRPALAVLGVVFLPIAGPLFRISTMVWTEPLFLALALLYLINIESYVEAGRARSLVIAASAVALACLTRYIGFGLIVAGLVTIIALGGGTRARLRDALVFLVISAVPLILWVARDYTISGTPFGPRTPSAVTLSQNLDAAFKFTLGWFAHGRTVGRRALLAGLIVIVGVGAWLRARRDWEVARSALRTLGPILILVVVYVGSLVVTSSITFSDKIEDRLLSPVYVPVTLLLLALACGASGFGSKAPARGFANRLLVVVAVFWLLSPTAMTARFVFRYAEQRGHGYGTKAWRKSATIHGLLADREVKLGQAVYTNAPDAVYILAGLPARRLPERREYSTADAIDDLWRLRGKWPEAGVARLVWFDAVDRKHLLSLNEIRVVTDLEPVFRGGDGVIYAMTRR